jgi:RNA polymerase sigma-70 factor (ECF subfamily)
MKKKQSGKSEQMKSTAAANDYGHPDGGMNTDFEDIYHQYKDIVYTYLFHQVSDKDIANDLFQDVMVKALNGFKDFIPTGSLKAWIIVIARNRLYDYRRKKVRWRRIISRKDSGSPDENNNFSTNIIHFESADVLEDEKEVRYQISQAIMQLSLEQREVIDLHYNLKLSLREISEVLNCSINTVASRARYGLKKLKKILEV